MSKWTDKYISVTPGCWQYMVVIIRCCPFQIQCLIYFHRFNRFWRKVNTWCRRWQYLKKKHIENLRNLSILTFHKIDFVWGIPIQMKFQVMYMYTIVDEIPEQCSSIFSDLYPFDQTNGNWLLATWCECLMSIKVHEIYNLSTWF